MPEKLKVAVVGQGNIGRGSHAPVYHTHPNCDLVAVCDIIPERADRGAQQFGCKAYYSVQEMLAAEQLDAVSVCTAGVENGGDHATPTLECLEAGLHVLCEKPLSNSLDSCRQMVAKAAEKGVCLGTNLNHRFTRLCAKAIEWIRDGRIGTPLSMNMTMWIGNPNETSPWFHIRALHPHSLDIMRCWCGDVKRVHAFFNKAPGRSADKPTVCYSNVQANLEFASGALGHLTGSYDTNPRHNLERAELLGTEGRIVLDDCLQELTLYPRRSDEKTVITRSIMDADNFAGTFGARINRWVEQLLAGAAPDQIEASGLEGYKVQAIIEAAIASFQGNCIAEVEV